MTMVYQVKVETDEFTKITIYNLNSLNVERTIVF